MNTQPTAIDARKDMVHVEWADGSSHDIDNLVLRGNCPCSTCNDVRERGERVEVIEGVRAHKLWLVGGYALGIEWSDSHSDGLFGFKLLRELGAACEAHRAAGVAPAAAEGAGDGG